MNDASRPTSSIRAILTASAVVVATLSFVLSPGVGVLAATPTNNESIRAPVGGHEIHLNHSPLIIGDGQRETLHALSPSNHPSLLDRPSSSGYGMSATSMGVGTTGPLGDVAPDLGTRYASKPSPPSILATGATYYMIKLGIYADINYCNAVPSWNLQLLQIVQDVNSIYNSEENAMLRMVNGPRCISGSDSWSSDLTTLLNQFFTWCAFSDAPCNDVEVAFLISGKDLSLGGDYTYVGGAKEPGKFSALEGLFGTSLGRARLASHEIGHNLWGDHAYADSWYDWVCLATGATIMYPWYQGDCSMKSYFSAANRKAIKAQIGSMTTNWLPYTAQTSTSPDELYAAKWWVQYPRIPTSSPWVTVHFYLVNSGSSSKTLTYIFVGCRNGPSQSNNCDFGYTGQVVIPPQGSYELTVSRQLSVTGVWQLWPAYYYNGHYGPYQWSMAQVPVVNSQVGYYPGPDTSPGGVRLTDFHIWAPSSTVHVGDTLFVDFAYANTLTGYMDFDPYGIFVGARDPSNANRDFGYRILRLWGSQSTVYPADQWTVLTASITVSSTGPWVFWPGYYLNGGWGPYKWHALTISVST